MNIFILDENIETCAKYHTDKHIVKMPTETAQMISYVYHDKEFWEKEIPEYIMGFSKSHYKHPCSIWIRQSLSNFLYACKLGLALYNEYQFRYEKPDKHTRAKDIFSYAIANPPQIEDKGLTPFVCAMDKEYIKYTCPIKNYQNYYREGKQHLFSWKKREMPKFLENNFVVS